MMFFALLPVIGTGLIWGPTAIYLLATGSLWQGFALIAFGVLIIGVVDNLLRPILIGQDTKIPDYVVLVSTLGGLAIFGPNGFVIGPIVAAMFFSLWAVFSTHPAARGGWLIGRAPAAACRRLCPHLSNRRIVHNGVGSECSRGESGTSPRAAGFREYNSYFSNPFTTDAYTQSYRNTAVEQVVPRLTKQFFSSDPPTAAALAYWRPAPHVRCEKIAVGPQTQLTAGC